MTNTTFRKRAMLSSIAMLLVAMLALGSATFAWYTTSPTATAAGLQMNTTAGAGLEIQTATDTRGYIKDAKLNFDAEAYTANSETIQSRNVTFNLQPASYIDGTGFVKVEAASGYYSTAGANNAIGPMTPVNNTSSSLYAAGASGVYQEQVDLKVTGGVAKVISIASVTINQPTTDTPAVASAVRVLITDTSGAVLGYYAPGANSGTELTFAAEDLDTTTPVVFSASTAGDGDNTNNATLTIDNKGTAKAITTEAVMTKSVYVYVFLYGFDENVKSATVNGDQILNSISISFSVPTT